MRHSIFWAICEKGKGNKYVELQNSVGQRWYIPLKNSRIHLSLFQPSSAQGKFVEYFFGIIKYFPIVLHFINAKIVRLEFTNEFQEFLEGVFGTKHCSIGVFCGSPGYHKKPTLLISKGNNILGYCKLTDNKCVRDLFLEESKCLTYLHSKGVINVPTSLFCGHLPYRESIWAFVQTTSREKKVKIAKYTNRQLLDFVLELNSKTKVYMPFHETDFSKSLDKLGQHLFLLGNNKQQRILENGIKVVKTNQNSFKFFCAAHGDLTPWNSFITKEGFFAFDLEYFKNSYTPWYDFFHFFTQEMLYRKYAKAVQIYSKYKYLRSRYFKNQDDADLFYLSYLLLIVGFYLDRDKGILNDRIKECMGTWTSLIEYVLKDVSKIN